MTGLRSSPPTIRGGIVVADPGSGRVLAVIPLQYNADTISRTLQPQAVPDDAGDRSRALRLKGAPIETIRLDAELDATDALEQPDRHPEVAEHGIAPRLAALETLLYPPTERLIANDRLQAAGTLEIEPHEAPLTLFVWSSERVVPVRITDMAITEEAFDARLNPLRARVSLTLRVLSVDDLGFGQRGGALYLGYQAAKERLAARATRGGLSDLGIAGI